MQNKVLKGGSLAILVFSVLIISAVMPDKAFAFSAYCTASPSSVVAGQAVNFTAYVSPAGSYTYNWSGDDSLSGNGQNATHVYATAGTYYAHFAVSSANGSVAGNCSVLVGNGSNNNNSNNNNNNYTAPVVQNDGPTYASCSASASSVNVGQSVNFTASTLPSTRSYRYSWSSGCTGSSSTCQNTFQNQGNYPVSVTVSGLSGNGSSITATCPITVNGNVNNHSYTQCYNGNVYWYNSNGSPTDIFQTCSSNQICQGNTCVNSVVNHSYTQCYNGNVYWYNSNGSPTDIFQTCTSNQTCSGNTCVTNINNHSYTQCYNGNVYWYNSNGSPTDVYQTCSSNQICQGNACVNNNTCTSNYQQRCSGNSLYWYDSCGNQQSLSQVCGSNQYCSGNACVNNNNNTCTSNYQQRCSGNSLYWYDSCGNQQSLSQVCGYNQTCSGNACVNNNYNNYNAYSYTQCYGSNIYWYDSNGLRQGLYKSCGSTSYYNTYANYCVGNSVYQRTNSSTYGCANNACYAIPASYSNYGTYVKTCGYNQTCSAGACITKATGSTYVYHYIKKCVTDGNSVYWYDSYGTKQDLVQACSADEICSEAICTQKPASEILGLALTILGKSEASDGQWAKNISVGGNQNINLLAVASNGTEKTMDNVVVTVALPNGILYKGNVMIDGVPYSGNVTAGIQLGSLSPKTTKAITFTSISVDESNFVQGTVTVTGTVNTSDGSSTDTMQVNLVRGLQVQAQQPTNPTSNGFLAGLLGVGSRNWLYILLAIIIIILIIIAIRRFNENK